MEMMSYGRQLLRILEPLASKNGGLDGIFKGFPMENLDLYYVLDVSFIRIEWFWRPWRRRGTI